MNEQQADQQMFEFDTFALDVEWHRENSESPNPPSLVGPFPSQSSAEGWAALNIPNGSWQVRPLAWPHYVSPDVAFRRGLRAATDAVMSLRDSQETR